MIALAAGYAMFAGWGVPAQRTVLMLAIVVGLRLAGRQWPWPAVWLWALAAVLLLDPWSWLQAGFWLSFVAVAILFATDPGRQVGPRPPCTRMGPERLGRRVARSVVGLVREQGVVTVALTPLSLVLFGQVSVVGFAANLLAIPWVTLVLTPLALVGIAVAPAWDLAAVAVHLLTAWLDWLAQWSWASVYRAVPPLGVGLLAVVGAVVLVLRLPWSIRLAGLMVLWPVLVWSPSRPEQGAFEVVAWDVGQGSAILVRTAGHSLLFDTGPKYSSHSDAGQRIVVPTLRAMGERLDTVVVSHKDMDHAGGMEAVQAAWPQARWLSSFDAEPSRRCLAGQQWTWDGVVFEMLHPGPSTLMSKAKRCLASNAMSCTLRISNAQRQRLAERRPGRRAGNPPGAGQPRAARHLADIASPWQPHLEQPGPAQHPAAELGDGAVRVSQPFWTPVSGRADPLPGARHSLGQLADLWCSELAQRCTASHGVPARDRKRRYWHEQAQEAVEKPAGAAALGQPRLKPWQVDFFKPYE